MLQVIGCAVLGCFGFMALVVGGGFYFFFARNHSSASSPTPTPAVVATITPAPAPPPANVTPDASPTVAAATPVPDTPAAPPEETPGGPAGEMQLSGTGLRKEIVCHGEKVVLNGMNNRLVVKGRVSSLDVNGSDNQVQVENAGEIHIQGGRNKVGWKGNKPKVVSAGADNHVERAP